MADDSSRYGLMAEFESPEAILHAAEEARRAGYVRLEAYTPFPVEGLAEVVGIHSSRVPLLCLVGGLIGCAGGFFLQWWPNQIGYPLVIGGKPFNSWPAFIPITFEMTILCAGLATVFGMLALNGLPHPYHPVFSTPGFELATRNRFFLCIRHQDPKYDAGETREFLQSLNAHEVSEIAA